MSDKLNDARLRAIAPDAGGINEIAEVLGMDTAGKKAFSRKDYQAYYDAQPHLHNTWNQVGGVWPTKSLQAGGKYDSGEIKKQINQGISVQGQLTGDLKGVNTKGNHTECEKENMGGKAMSEAGFGCWQFWHEVAKHTPGYKSGVGGTLTPTGSTITKEELYKELEKNPLTKTQEKNLMLQRWGGMGISDFNNFMTQIKRGVKSYFGKDLDDAGVAQYMSQNGEDVITLMENAKAKYDASKALSDFNKAKSEQNDEAMDVASKLGEEAAQKIAETSNLVPPAFIDNEDGTSSLDPSLMDDFERLTVPYSFETNSRYYSNTVIEDGERVDTDDYWLGSDVPGYITHPKLGTVYQSEATGDWMYSPSLGDYIYQSPESDEWFYSQDTQTWMYPTITEGAGLSFYSLPEGAEPDEGQWLGPDQEDGEGSYYSYETKEFVNFDDIKNFSKDAETGLSVPADKGDPDQIITTPNLDGTDPGVVGEESPIIEEREYDEVVSRTEVEEGYELVEYNDGEKRLIYQPDMPDSGGMMQPTVMPDKRTEAILTDDEVQLIKTEGLSAWKTLKYNPPMAAPPQEDKPASLISYDRAGSIGSAEDRAYKIANAQRELREKARDLKYEGMDKGLIMGLLSETEAYKDFMDFWTGEDDKVEAQILLDDIVEQVAEENKQRANITGSLDMFDSSGAGMLDPNMSDSQKLAIRTAKPSRPATEGDVAAGRATSVGEIIDNPDYDPRLSYYAEYQNPITGELETIAYRPDMPGKQSFMAIQERLLDESKRTMENHLSDLVDPVGDTGKSKYQAALDKQISSLKKDGIMAGGEDDPNTAVDESLGLYANEGAAALNYVYGDNENSLKGITDDYYEMQKNFMDQRNYLNRMDAQRDLDISSKIRAATDDLDPVERARDRSAERIKLARFGGGEVNSDLGGISQPGGLYEPQLQEELKFKNLDNVTGLGDTYDQGELEVAGIDGGLYNMPKDSEEIKENQFYDSFKPLGKSSFIKDSTFGTERQRRV